jgi:hypothetical protein
MHLHLASVAAGSAFAVGLIGAGTVSDVAAVAAGAGVIAAVVLGARRGSASVWRDVAEGRAEQIAEEQERARRLAAAHTTLRERVARLEALPDLASLASALATHEQRAAERHAAFLALMQRLEAASILRDTAMLDALNRIGRSVG